MQIQSRSVLLTGATGGLGHAIARALAQHGARLLLTGRRPGVLESLAREVGGEALAVDLSDRAELDALIERTGDVDILVANAGLPGTGRLDELPVEAIDRVLDVNLRAPILLARAVTGPMRRRGAGHIVLVSSVSGLAFSPHASLYCASKAGLRAFGLALREELRGTGVGVSIVYPGPIRDAGMFAETGVEMPMGVSTSSPEEVAAAVVRAIERDRGQITVAALPIRAALPLALLAPGVNAAVQRKLGGNRTAETLAKRQRHKL
jgi:short-subunit dehydrogenase